MRAGTNAGLDRRRCRAAACLVLAAQARRRLGTRRPLAAVLSELGELPQPQLRFQREDVHSEFGTDLMVHGKGEI